VAWIKYPTEAPRAQIGMAMHVAIAKQMIPSMARSRMDAASIAHADNATSMQ